MRDRLLTAQELANGVDLRDQACGEVCVCVFACVAGDYAAAVILVWSVVGETKSRGLSS